MMSSTEVYGSNGSLGSNGCLTHNLSGFHPCGSIGYLTRWIQILDNRVMFQQLARFVGSHNDFPRSGIIRHNIHGAIHHGSQCIFLLIRSEIFGQTPVIHIRIGKGSPYSTGKFQCQGAFHGSLDVINGQMFEVRLCPLFRPCHRSFGECIFRQVSHHFMENGFGMFGKEIAESDALIVSTHLDVKPIA